MIDNAHLFWDAYGPVFKDTNDIFIGKAASGFNTNHGWRFLGCGAVHIDTLAVGDETNTVTLVEINQSAGSTFNRTSIGKLYLFKGDTGLVAKNGDTTIEQNLKIGSIVSVSNSTYGVDIDSVRGVKIDWLNSYDDGVGLKIGGTAQRMEIGCKIYNSDYSGAEVDAGASRLKLTGYIHGANTSGSTGKSELDIQSTDKQIVLDGLLLEGIDTAQNLNVVAGNQVEIYGTKIPTVSGTPYIYNNQAQESANAEQPQGTYPPGTIVDFTDTGDGSGTGVYLLRNDGEAWIQLA